MERFWMCYVEGSQGCRYQHASFGDAKTEAERLARLESNIGCRVVILEAKSFCIVQPAPVVWCALPETQEQEALPF